MLDVPPASDVLLHLPSSPVLFQPYVVCVPALSIDFNAALEYGEELCARSRSPYFCSLSRVGSNKPDVSVPQLLPSSESYPKYFVESDAPGLVNELFVLSEYNSRYWHPRFC